MSRKSSVDSVSWKHCFGVGDEHDVHDRSCEEHMEGRLSMAPSGDASAAATSTANGTHDLSSERAYGGAQTVDSRTNLEEYKLDETAWEAAAVVGLPGLNFLDNVSIATGLVFNVFVQVLFCVIAYQSFTDERFPTSEEVQRWRYTVGHDVKWSDSTEVSLTSRVCGGGCLLDRIHQSVGSCTRDHSLFVGLGHDLLLHGGVSGSTALLRGRAYLAACDHG